MDKYELNVKIEQIKKLARQKDYAAAARVADSIDFYKVKDNKTLSLLADVYEASGKYDQAKEILVEAYARTSLGRQLAYRLVKLSIKSGNIGEAEEFYEDFIEVAPRDNSRYILQYQLASAKGEPLENRISILETYLGDEMDEKWAFELAKLYHKTGQRDKCVKQCDDIILWFNDGKYVDKSMELKMIYTPLSKAQQAKYEERWMAKAPSNINVEEIKVKEFDAANRYNTVNIQDALKESMGILLDDEPENAGDENVSQPSDMEKTKVIFTDKVIDSLLSHTVVDMKIPESKYNTVPLDPMFNIDGSGQIELATEEPVDEQIEGQMTIEELLAAYEAREAREAQVLSELSDHIEEDEEELQESQEIITEEITEEEKEEITEDIGAHIEEEVSQEQQGKDTTNIGMNMSLTGDISSIEAALEEAAAAIMNEVKSKDDIFPEGEPVEEEPVEEEPVEEEPVEEEPVEEEPVEEESVEEEPVEEEPAKEEQVGKSENQLNNQAVKELIKSFVSKYSGVQGLDRQLLKVLQESLLDGNTRIVVMGEIKSGKTELGIDLIKILNKIKQVRGRKIAKINGEILNSRSVTNYFEKLQGMDIIIEKAGALSENTVKEIVMELRKQDENKIIVLEDEKNSAENLLKANTDLEEIFKSRVVVKQNKVRDWAIVAKNYAKEQGFEIDEMGMLALHAQIDALYAISLVINRSQVERVIDRAIERSEKKGLGRIFKLIGKQKEKTLKEEDFAN